MPHRFKRIARSALHSLGAITAVRRFNRNSLRILMYHTFSQDTTGLREQCRHIRRYYQPLSLKSICESLETGRALPQNNLAVTVDDGYRDFFLYAHAVFREYEIYPTIFVISDFLDQKLWPWWNQIAYVFKHTSLRSVQLPFLKGETRNYVLDTEEQRLRAGGGIVDALLTVGDDERHELINLIIGVLGVTLPTAPPFEWAPLTWDQLRHMTRDGVEVGAHTRTHPILSRIRDIRAIREELESCKLRIEEEIGQPPLHFCYPNGKLADIDKRSVDAVKECGFRTAVTSERGLNYVDADPFLLRRIGVEPDGATHYFQELLAGIVDAPGAKARYSSLK
jgi:peptidoglycan/xylan/chitin deacetylase (PgdA/CDA1 family)